MRKVALNCVWMRDVVRYMMTWEDGMENMPDARWMDRSRLGRGGGRGGILGKGKSEAQDRKEQQAVRGTLRCVSGTRPGDG